MALPLCSSQQVVSALGRCGCTAASRKQKGSHKVWQRVVAGRTLSAPVPMGKTKVARGTLGSILTLLSISEDEFRDALR